MNKLEENLIDRWEQPWYRSEPDRSGLSPDSTKKDYETINLKV